MKPHDNTNLHRYRKDIKHQNKIKKKNYNDHVPTTQTGHKIISRVSKNNRRS